MTKSEEVRQFWRLRQLLNSPDAGQRHKASLRLVKFAHLAQHGEVYRQAFAMVEEAFGFDLVHSESRDAVTSVRRTDDSAGAQRVASR